MRLAGRWSSAECAALYAQLTAEMAKSVNDLAVVRSFVDGADAAARQRLATLSPAEFAALVAAVDLEFERAQVCEILARSLGPGFAAAHLAAAVEKAGPMAKTKLVKQCAHLCADIGSEAARGAITAKLDSWEQIVVEQALKNAVAEKAV